MGNCFGCCGEEEDGKKAMSASSQPLTEQERAEHRAKALEAVEKRVAQSESRGTVYASK